MRTLALALALALSSASACSAATLPEPADLGPALEALRAAHEVPALVGMAWRRGAVVAQGVAGTRRAGDPAPAQLGDAFHFGSNGKSLTATLLARLVEAGTLRWDTTLAEVFPELGETLHPDYRGVTLEELLSHTGGLPGNPSDGLMMRFFQEPLAPRAQRALAATEALTRPAALPPGTAWSYSNLGYTLAGMAAERASGEPFEDLVRTQVLEPLGMVGAGFGAPGTPGQLDQPWGHLILPEGLPGAGERVAIDPGMAGADNPPGIAPAGTLHAPPGAWMRYLAMHLGAGPEGFLRRESLRKLHTPRVELEGGMGYALGWLVRPRPEEGALVFHDGSNNKWFAYTALAPEVGEAYLAATNQGVAGGAEAALAALQLVMAEARAGR